MRRTLSRYSAPDSRSHSPSSFSVVEMVANSARACSAVPPRPTHPALTRNARRAGLNSHVRRLRWSLYRADVVSEPTSHGGRSRLTSTSRLRTLNALHINERDRAIPRSSSQERERTVVNIRRSYPKDHANLEINSAMGRSESTRLVRGVARCCRVYPSTLRTSVSNT
jgi:hypothetical protein